MRPLRLPLFLGLLIYLPQYAVGSTEPNGSISGVVEALANAEIAKLEIFYYPVDILTRSRVTPEGLEKNYRFKLIIRGEAAPDATKEFLVALKGSELNVATADADFRWGSLFYDGSGKLIASIYLNDRRTIALINGLKWNIDSNLGDWIVATSRKKWN